MMPHHVTVSHDGGSCYYYPVYLSDVYNRFKNNKVDYK